MSKHLFPEKPHEYVYGPVPSRRLGRSLGIDIVPCKLCTYDCVYCQLGRTDLPSVRRTATVDVKRFQREIKDAVEKNPSIDCVTVAGSGEPTLSRDLAACARVIKASTDKPLVLITNGSLFSRRDVRSRLNDFDLLIPSLDAVTEAVFKALDRPHRDIAIKQVVRGLCAVRERYAKAFYLEVMLVKGYNDTCKELTRIAQTAALIQPDAVQINLPARSPTSQSLMPSVDMIDYSYRVFADHGLAVQIVGKRVPLAVGMPKKEDDLYQEVVATLKRRPVTIEDLTAAAGCSRAGIARIIKAIASSGYTLQNNDGYFRIVREKGKK